MSANLYILALHVLALFLWIGNLLVLSRLMGFHMEQPADVQARLIPLEKRLYLLGGLPAGIVALATGLLMLHGVGSPFFANPGQALTHYLKPVDAEGARMPWYVTFHVKLVSFVILLTCDIWLGRQVRRISRGNLTAAWWPLGIVLGLASFMVVLVLTWLALDGFGVGPSRQVGIVIGLIVAVAVFFGARKLAASPGRARFSAIHGAVAALLALIILLIIAKPLLTVGLSADVNA